MRPIFLFNILLASVALLVCGGLARSQAAQSTAAISDVCHAHGAIAPVLDGTRIMLIERWPDGSFARVHGNYVLTKEQLESAVYTGLTAWPNAVRIARGIEFPSRS